LENYYSYFIRKYSCLYIIFFYIFFDFCFFFFFFFVTLYINITKQKIKQLITQILYIKYYGSIDIYVVFASITSLMSIIVNVINHYFTIKNEIHHIYIIFEIIITFANQNIDGQHQNTDITSNLTKQHQSHDHAQFNKHKNLRKRTANFIKEGLKDEQFVSGIEITQINISDNKGDMKGIIKMNSTQNQNDENIKNEFNRVFSSKDNLKHNMKNCFHLQNNPNEIECKVISIHSSNRNRNNNHNPILSLHRTITGQEHESNLVELQSNTKIAKSV